MKISKQEFEFDHIAVFFLSLDFIRGALNSYICTVVKLNSAFFNNDSTVVNSIIAR